MRDIVIFSRWHNNLSIQCGASGCREMKTINKNSLKNINFNRCRAASNFQRLLHFSIALGKTWDPFFLRTHHTRIPIFFRFIFQRDFFCYHSLGVRTEGNEVN